MEPSYHSRARGSLVRAVDVFFYGAAIEAEPAADLDVVFEAVVVELGVTTNKLCGSEAAREQGLVEHGKRNGAARGGWKCWLG